MSDATTGKSTAVVAAQKLSQQISQSFYTPLPTEQGLQNGSAELN